MGGCRRPPHTTAALDHRTAVRTARQRVHSLAVLRIDAIQVCPRSRHRVLTIATVSNDAGWRLFLYNEGNVESRGGVFRMGGEVEDAGASCPIPLTKPA